MEFLNIFQSSKISFGHPFFVEVVGIAGWNTWSYKNALIFQNIPVSFLMWKNNFKKDFAMHMHRAKEAYA